jgi:alkylation response protein AidB-like acyl-CoA dehydrogenase
MSIAISEEHQELARVARAFLTAREARVEARAMLGEGTDRLPSFWKEMAELGWMGLHIDETLGGQGFGLAELAIVSEALGYAMAPGPYLPTTLTAAVLSERGSETVCNDFLPRLVDGSIVGAVGLNGALSLSDAGSLDGSAGLVLGAELGDVLLLSVGEDAVLVEREAAGLTIEVVKNIDPSRRAGLVTCDGVQVPPDHVLRGARGRMRELARILSAAEAAGGARACTEMATDYAKVRVQFGRPIGTFQAVKHHCANMLVATEQATAGAWGGSRSDLEEDEAELAAAIASCLALPAFVYCAEQNIQVHGGIGFTWEHDAHLYLRRANVLLALFGPSDSAREDVTRLMAQGVETRTTVELPPESELIRQEVKRFTDTYRALPDDQQRKSLSDSGYLMPHWPKPWGRDADPFEQLVIEEEFVGLARVNMGISGWNTLTIAQHGTPEQIERWVRPSMEGEIEFCQLFSEPAAGSDAAAVQTRGIKVDGGWRVTGQKVWTSGAHLCNRGFATVRTNPDAAKHAGISMMVIDMHAEGVEVRPLRQITGHAHFNEVFFDQVFVPDDDVVGPVDQGWTVARNNLGNERVSIGSGGQGGMGRGSDLIKLMQKHAPDDVGIAREVGAALAERESATLLNLRGVVRAVEGVEPGAEANVTKLLSSEIDNRVSSLGARIIGELAAVKVGDESKVAMVLLATRGMSIGGGTSEIARNQIAEKLLGLPRDPLIK